jgi:pimeloyl-ACP methyl ester carboxylesterase
LSTRSAYQLTDEEVERFLRSRQHSAILEEYFGATAYRELLDLNQEASARSVRGGPRVLILPGIMGSKLGIPGRLFNDVIWIDPVDVVAGNLRRLALDGLQIEPLGVMLIAYLKLKLRLRVAGFDADFSPFDWRQSLDRLGAELLQGIAAEPARPVHLVAHSMGGLVARAALARDSQRRIGRLVMLGTPNYGSFAPVLALTATHPFLRKIAAVDLAHTAEELAERVFRTFPGLHQMLPSPERFSRVDLFDPKTWPPGPGPNPDLLRQARQVLAGLAEADERSFLIAGVNQETITDGRREGNSFVYEITRNGDGTVPLAFCELPGAKTYYVEEEHGSLPNNRAVAEAAIDILTKGSTERLPSQPPPAASRAARTVSHDALRLTPFEGRRGREISRAELRNLLEGFVSPDAHDREAPGERPPSAPASGAGDPPASYVHPFQQVVVGRRRQRPLEIRLALGSITEVWARAYVLGLYKGVDPSGPAAAIDAHLGGAVREFATRRMFSAQVGEVFAMPTGRHRLFAETVLFAGLGTFDAFNAEVQQFVAENIVRTFVRTNVDDFATVLLGAGSGTSIAKSVFNHLVGFFRGLRDADAQQQLRRIIFCEIDRSRFLELKEELYRLASTDLFEDIQVTFSEVELPAPTLPAPRARRAYLEAANPIAYLVVRQEASDAKTTWLRSSVLTAGAKATVLTGVRQIPRAALTGLLGQLDGGQLGFAGLEPFGRALADLILFEDVANVLSQMQEYHLAVVHDAPASRVPWETLCIKGWFPAATGGVSRRYAADNLSVAKWLEQRRYGPQLDVLLVVNPTEDLQGAEDEAKRIESQFPSQSRVRLHKIHGAQATRNALLAAFRSGTYDVIHYAGHAHFDSEEPSLSGLLCHDGVLTGANLAGLSQLPALVFFNACESGRVRGGRRAAPDPVRKRIDKNVGLAEAFLRGGVANYVGTYWPVGDAAASAFAGAFYGSLIQGDSIGIALNAGRRVVRDLKSVDWVDYLHYGSFGFTLKNPEGEA